MSLFFYEGKLIALPACSLSKQAQKTKRPKRTEGTVQPKQDRSVGDKARSGWSPVLGEATVKHKSSPRVASLAGSGKMIQAKPSLF